MIKHTIRKISSFVMVAALFTGVGWYAHKQYTHHFYQIEKRVKRSGFHFVSPLLDVELPQGYDIRQEPIPFRYKVAEFIDQQIKAGNVVDMSVYYRDLGDGPWFGINEDKKYNPASMMKVPIMIAWLKRAEKTPSVLQRKYTFDEKTFESPLQNTQATKTLTPGYSYTVEKLLDYMMNFSDNRAMWLLYHALGPEEINQVVNNMDIETDMDGEYNSISVHGYSGFLRILYNASFLTPYLTPAKINLDISCS